MGHEKLECYGRLLKLAEEAARKVARWPRSSYYLKDQLMRAMTSAILNLAEGNGKRGSKDERHRFFRISLGSIAEVAAAMDIAHSFRLITRQEFESFVSMLKLSAVQIKALP